MSKDERLMNYTDENNDNLLKAEIEEFIKKDLIFMDDYAVSNDKSFYIYLEKEEDKLWYIFNDKGQYYNVYEELTDIMLYIEEGNMGNRLFSLTDEEMTIIDGE